MTHPSDHYTAIRVSFNPKQRDLFERLSTDESLCGIEEKKNEYIFYIQGEKTEEYHHFCEKLKKSGLEYRTEVIQPENWNEKWEKAFPPVYIGSDWLIRATFHPPDNKVEREIIIAPKMAFGTGHHPTTKMMLEQMLQIDFKLKRVLDLGCGTGILSIAAEKLDAARINAIDYDPLSVENSRENAQLNHCSRIQIVEAEIDACEGLRYDIILANINKNVILSHLQQIEDLLFPGGEILFSGILCSDSQSIKEKVNELEFIRELNEGDWSCLHFKKSVPPIKTP